MKADAEVCEAQFLVELGVSAARHIEIEMVFGFPDNLDIQTAAMREIVDATIRGLAAADGAKWASSPNLSRSA